MTDFYKIRTDTYDKEHIHFGGVIYLSDFNTDHRGKDNINGSSIASRIEADLRRENVIKNALKGRNNTYGKQ